MFAVWAIVSALLDGSKRLVVSILSLALGIILLASPLRDHALLLLAVSAYGVIAGALRLFIAGRASRPAR